MNLNQKNRVFGVSKELDDLLRLYSQREGISVSKFIRTVLIERIENLKKEEENFWMEFSEGKMTELISSLSNYLSSRISINPKNCNHGAIFTKDISKNFKHTKEFCENLHIEFLSFLNRVESDFKLSFDCECELYGNIKNEEK